jgi:general secretion pathway protein H
MSAIGKPPPGPPIARTAEDGFTLIEALVTVGIAALVAGIAFPSIERGLAFWRFSEAEATVRTAIEQARASALRGGDAVSFVARTDGRSYAVGAGPIVELPQGVRFEHAPVTLVFFADGSAHGGRLRIVGERRARWFSVTSDTGLLDVAS